MRRQGAIRRGLAGALFVVGFLLASASAQAFEFLDGKLSVHGFFEEQLRFLGRDLSYRDNIDLAQWYHVLDLELEWNVAPDGWGPFDAISAFVRLEARYDCVWTRACGLFPQANTYGDRAKHLPDRLIDAHQTSLAGTLLRQARFPDGVVRADRRRYSSLAIGDDLGNLDLRPGNGDARAPLFFYNAPGWNILFGTGSGPDRTFGTADDPTPFIFSDLLDKPCRYAARRTRGFRNGIDNQGLGPWTPGCEITPIGMLRDKPNPFRGHQLVDPRSGQVLITRPDAGDLNPVVSGAVGAFELPYRVAPLASFIQDAPEDEPQGVFIPSPKLRQLIRDDKFGPIDFNFRQDELAWNRGASQQNERELKEAYLDIEMFDSRLWLRIGKQDIVWGKTELFRTTDQFNPQDFGLATIPTLEESRIPLWAVRAVWSFYEVGPLEDVRLELAMNYDQFEPSDFGRCGEPFSATAICAKSWGLLAHAVAGIGLAGEIRPPDPWDSSRGIEWGARLEFRWDRFSFQLSDFYGYDDFPYVQPLFFFERNVDPRTGRPRRAGARGPCTTGDPAVEPACLGPGLDALYNHSANTHIYALICATAVGVTDLDPAACGTSIFNSQLHTIRVNDGSFQFFFAPRLMAALNSMMAGSCQAALGAAIGGCAVMDGLGLFNATTRAALSAFPNIASVGGVVTPLVALIRNPNDGGPDPLPSSFADPLFPDPLPGDTAFQGFGLAPVLTDEQEALLGCGRFFDTFCDVQGIDLLNAEASAIVQSWPGFEGTFGDWSTLDASRPQPGTVGFQGGPVCTRYEGGKLFVLPGCRKAPVDFGGFHQAPDPGYDEARDGSVCHTVSGKTECLLHPFTGQPFQSEMAALSFNIGMVLVTFSQPPLVDTNGDGTPDATTRPPRVDEFDPDHPLRLDGCSFAKPHLCWAFAGILRDLSVRRNTIRAGGNGRFGRREFEWHDGAEAALRYDHRNVLGFAFDWAEDVTKTNWSVEMTWIANAPMTDNDDFNLLSRVDLYNLTISMDRPTFVNFLNANRTFFFNTQWFLQYIRGYRSSFSANGPYNILTTFTVTTGYFQDRLLPAFTGIYDFGSHSGGLMPQLAYRFTENFSATFGVNVFWGGMQPKPMGVRDLATGSNRVGKDAYRNFVENGLSPVSDHDEIFLKIRYTF